MKLRACSLVRHVKRSFNHSLLPKTLANAWRVSLIYLLIIHISERLENQSRRQLYFISCAETQRWAYRVWRNLFFDHLSKYDNSLGTQFTVHCICVHNEEFCARGDLSALIYHPLIKPRASHFDALNSWDECGNCA